MRKVIIFDVLGSHCGMHYYDIAFADILRENGCTVEIASNFSEEEGSRPCLRQMFSCSKACGIFRLAMAYWAFLSTVLKGSADRIVYLAYGEIYELPFLAMSSFSSRVYVDVHEIHALKYKDDSNVSKLFEWVYKHLIHHVIYHSERTQKILGDSKANMLYVPHFKYAFQKKYDYAKLQDDVKKCFLTGRTKFLFFGNLSTVKGIDIVMDVFGRLEDYNDKFELVIAGQNVENIDLSKIVRENIAVVGRHISDDELVYLYSKTDFVLLPYKKSSQSGIFAMAAYFRKPMILSDIPYFRNMLEEYPSFGICVNLKNYGNAIVSLLKKSKSDAYFVESDCNRFEEKKDINEFVINFIGK